MDAAATLLVPWLALRPGRPADAPSMPTRADLRAAGERPRAAQGRLLVLRARLRDAQERLRAMTEE